MDLHEGEVLLGQITDTLRAEKRGPEVIKTTLQSTLAESFLLQGVRFI